MSDTEELHEDKPFAIERAKQGRATCKHCKQKCIQGELRLAKLVPNPFGDGKMKSWFHVNCMFEQFMKQRQTTKRIENSQDVEGWDQLSEDDKDILLSHIDSCDKAFEAKYGVKVKKSPKTITSKRKSNSSQKKLDTASSTGSKERVHLLFKEFRRLIADISNVNSYLDKTKIVNTIFMKGRNGNGFKGDITLWCKLLLPGVIKRVYNLQSKQLIKIFSKLFNSDLDDMLEHLEQGDIGETIQHFFENSKLLKPAKKSLLTVNEVDSFLEHLTTLTKEEEQTNHFKSFIVKCTSNDLKTVIRLIKHDLRMNAGAKHILDGVHPDAYQAYQSSRDIDSVISRCLGDSRDDKKKTVEATINVMIPVLPMLAEACKSVEQAMKKCPNGMYSEIKYDGERVQVHKQGSEFKYFSRSLKPVMPHKIAHFRDYIPKAFPSGHDLILDSEILMIDTVTGKPLPFGTLGKHKKKELEDASVCLFVFDCIYYNGEVLTNKPITYRKKILLNNMIEIPNHIVFSEIETIHKPEDLTNMIAKVLKLGLEGLVLKGLMSTYEPGKRHWLKVKKDYLFDGAMADSADLIVLGAWYGTGKKGGKMSVFLMGCFDQNKNKFCTVTKVHTGHDDKTLEKLQTELDMNKISCDPSKVPSWLHCTKTMIPDFVAKDPINQPVWEITGAEFTQHDVHTANGISIRFPRVTKIRNDKDWKSATSVEELTILYKKSKEHTDVSLLMKTLDNRDDNSVSSSSTTSSKNVTPTKPKNEENEILAYDVGHKNILQKRKHSGSPKSKNKKLKEDESANFEATESNVDENDMILKPRKMQKNSADVGGEITSTQQKFEHLHRQSSKKKLKKDEDVNIEDNRSKKLSYRINGQIHKPLPNYFANINLLIDNTQEDNQNHIKWIRYFVAYGGTLLSSLQHSEVTHILHSKNTISEPSIIYPHTVRHITVEWIKDSVTLGYLQPCTEYTVIWRPS